MVYLLHFETKFHHAQHYLGYTESETSLHTRLEHHRHGSGARLMAAVSQAGIAWQVARKWPEGDRFLERRLKNRHKSSELCPICMKERGMQ